MECWVTAAFLSASSRCCLGYLLSLPSSPEHRDDTFSPETRGDQSVNYALFKSSLHLSTDNPILRPFPAVNIPLTVVVSNCLLLRYVIFISRASRLLRQREIMSDLTRVGPYETSDGCGDVFVLIILGASLAVFVQAGSGPARRI